MQKQNQIISFSSLPKNLNRGLKHEIYEEESVEVIKMTRIIFNLPPLAIKLKHFEGGYIKLGLTQFPLFINSARQILTKSLTHYWVYKRNVLKNQYKVSPTIITQKKMNRKNVIQKTH